MMKKNILIAWLCIMNLTVCFGQNRAQTLRNRYITPIADDANRIWIMAHRGAWDEQNPESSLTSFQNAVAYGFEILELDMRFSASYNVNGSPSRDIILQHDKSNQRSDFSNGTWKPATGLYSYSGTQTFDATAMKPNKSMVPSINGATTPLSFILLDKLLPFTSNSLNSIDAAGPTPPILLKLDGSNSTSSLLHFPKTAVYTTNTSSPNYNASWNSFYTAVNGNILLNFDKMKDPQDFQDTYDLMNNNGLLSQCIFKAKGINQFSDLNALFGNTTTTVRNLSNMMFTPIFTKYDYATLDANSNITGPKMINGVPMTQAQILAAAEATVNSLNTANANGQIVFPGCEIVYETDASDPNFGWLASLADYVKNTLGKRVVQFSTNIENRQGAWSGTGNYWSALVGAQVNYWSWLYNNPPPSISNIKASVFVGDKPLEFRAYLNSLGYNQTPIQ